MTEVLEILTAIRADIAGIKSDVAELKSDVAELKSDVAGLKSDVAELKSDVAGLKSDVAGLKSDVAELKSDVAELKAVQAEHTQQLAHMGRSTAMLQQDVTRIRNIHLGQELKLDDIQDHIRRVALGIENLRPPAIPPTLGEGSPSELRILHSEFNALQRKTAELQARIELLEGRRTW